METHVDVSVVRVRVCRHHDVSPGPRAAPALPGLCLRSGRCPLCSAARPGARPRLRPHRREFYRTAESIASPTPGGKAHSCQSSSSPRFPPLPLHRAAGPGRARPAARAPLSVAVAEPGPARPHSPHPRHGAEQRQRRRQSGPAPPALTRTAPPARTCPQRTGQLAQAFVSSSGTRPGSSPARAAAENASETPKQARAAHV